MNPWAKLAVLAAAFGLPFHPPLHQFRRPPDSDAAPVPVKPGPRPLAGGAYAAADLTVSDER